MIFEKNSINFEACQKDRLIEISNHYKAAHFQFEKFKRKIGGLSTYLSDLEDLRVTDNCGKTNIHFAGRHYFLVFIQESQKNLINLYRYKTDITVSHDLFICSIEFKLNGKFVNHDPVVGGDELFIDEDNACIRILAEHLIRDFSK